MKLPSGNAMLLNGAAILFVGASLAVVVRSTFVADEVAPCKERYAIGTRLSLERQGAPVTTAELQSQLANSDWGLLDAARVVPVKSGPTKLALELDLAKAEGTARTAGSERAGIGFNWAPGTFKRREAACLTYSVMPGEGFGFGKGGRLPGLQGTSSGAGSDATPEAFSMRFAWSGTGEIGVHPDLPRWPEGRSLNGWLDKPALKPGRWNELEQEVVLNTPGKADGVLRLGRAARLARKKTDVVLGSSPAVMISGVLAETAGGATGEGAKGASQKVSITPFELRWPRAGE